MKLSKAIELVLDEAETSAIGDCEENPNSKRVSSIIEYADPTNGEIAWKLKQEDLYIKKQNK